MTGIPRWRVSKDPDPSAPDPWLVDRPGCELDRDSHPHPCSEQPTYIQALAYVAEQLQQQRRTP